MSVSDFYSLSSTKSYAALLARGSGATLLAACFVCVAVTNGRAASSALVEVESIPYLAPAAPASIRAAAATFASRFDCRQTSPDRNIIERAIDHAPMMASLLRKQTIIPAGRTIVGTASMYNPGDPKDHDAGNMETASGERYDANDWTAAIRTDLRAQFGGVRFGKNYRAAFALVKTSAKQAIVRINDVGKLRRGRIIDLNERAMRYFDPTLQLGLIDNLSVTPLVGQNWALGPLIDHAPVSFASRFSGVVR